MINELILIIVFIVARLIVWQVERVCKNSMNKVWTLYFYLITAGSIGIGLVLLTKEGWLERVGLEKTAGVVIILGIILLYWIMMMVRFLGKYKQARHVAT